LEDIHHFAAKLRHPGVVRGVVDAVRTTPDDIEWPAVGTGPLSINLDLTTSCNYRCDHCIDFEMLNSGPGFPVDTVLRSLVLLRLSGLRSVILIGGGEPTSHPRFAQVVAAAKALGLQLAIVSNGSNNQKIATVAPRLSAGDWVRLSLDAGTDATFQAMHRPRRNVTLDGICAAAQTAKRANPKVSWGFSFIASWPGLVGPSGNPLVNNVPEMAAAARLARDSGFDYISFKPMLVRSDEASEGTWWPSGPAGQALRDEVNEQVRLSRVFEDETFRVVVSENLRVLLDAGAVTELLSQPRRCRLHLFRTVLTTQGIFGCPAYRDDPRSLLAGGSGYSTVDDLVSTLGAARRQVEVFDASTECRNIRCVYNDANWWLEEVASGAAGPHVEVPLGEEVAADCFL
jgi:hypothetical protein